MSLEKEFEDALWAGLALAKKKGQAHPRFESMLKTHRGFETARILTGRARAEPQSGLRKLAGIGLGECSMEYLMLTRKYRSEFNRNELDVARYRLDQLSIKHPPK